MEELKPCPFCGSNESRSRSTDRYGEFRHIGTGANCPISGQIFTPKLWNTRIPPATVGNGVDEDTIKKISHRHQRGYGKGGSKCLNF